MSWISERGFRLKENTEPIEISRERRRELVIEGCLEMADVYLEMTAEWSAVDDKSWQDL